MYSLTFSEKYWEICSIGETTGRKLCQTCPEEFVSYTKKFLSRIYPAAKRVDSSNYNPVEFWNCGCQLGKKKGFTPGKIVPYSGVFIKGPSWRVWEALHPTKCLFLTTLENILFH